MKYRVIFEIVYHEVWFDFSRPSEAMQFAMDAVKHSIESEDSKKIASVTIKVIKDDTAKEEVEF